MADIHKKMYATVVASVDSVIAALDFLADNPDLCTRESLEEVSKKLKDALLKAEDMYINAAEEQTGE